MYKRLLDLRDEYNHNQEYMAKLLNITQETYSRYETGVLDISSQSLIILARHYNTSVDYLLGLTDEPKPYKRSTGAHLPPGR